MTDNTNPYDAPDTGHVWDENLRELTNPPPRWWTIAFHASWIFVIIYGILYPMVPLVSSHTKGVLGWTSIGEFKESVAELDAIRGPFEAKIAELEPAAILADRELANYTDASAKVLFGDRCAPCHGAGGQGNPGYPVLADDAWLYGGEIGGLADGRDHEAGKVLFTGKAACFACHGMDGKGNQMIGAPDLTDRIWRFAGTPEAIRQTITHGVNDPSDPETRSAEMPAFSGTLDTTGIKKLAVYVHRLGGGQ